MRYILLILLISLISAHSEASEQTDRIKQRDQHRENQKDIQNGLNDIILTQLKSFRGSYELIKSSEKITKPQFKLANMMFKTKINVFSQSITQLIYVNKYDKLWFYINNKRDKQLVGLQVSY